MKMGSKLGCYKNILGINIHEQYIDPQHVTYQRYHWSLSVDINEIMKILSTWYRS